MKSGANMTNKNMHIWIWLQNGKIIKAISNIEDGTIRIFDEDDRLIMKRTGLTRFQIKQIELNLLIYGAKKLSKHAEPFEYL